MTESSYDLMFSKLARARLFNMYFDESRNVLAQFVLQPADDPRVDVTGRVISSHGFFSFQSNRILIRIWF
jgi:hypothetical protein